MATRAYRRDNNGRFAGSGGGTKVTYGKAGGFANAGFRQRVAASRGNASPGRGPTGQKASAGRSMGATAGAKGRPPRRQVQRSRTSRVVTFAAKNPHLTVATGVVAYRTAQVANQSIAVKAHNNRVAAAAARAAAPPKMSTARRRRGGTYKVTTLR